VSVDYRTEDGTATVADDDYTAIPVQTLDFAPGQTSKQVTVKVTGDTNYEATESVTLALDNPAGVTSVDSVASGTIANDDHPNFFRPKGATPLYASLVIAHAECTSPDRTHGPALSFPSCSGPTQLSDHLTVGTPDVNGANANAAAFVRFGVVPGDPDTPADEANLGLNASVTDVRVQGTLDDYTGELWATAALRLTDLLAGGDPATVSDLEFGFAVPCAATADPGVGATCSVATSADAVAPGSAPEKSRAVWELGQVTVHDGGSDGEGETTADNTPFLVQGIFTP
jgi:hypothetical protein